MPEDELLARLVALNAERRAEEARGRVRWLRPAYQAPRLGARVLGAGKQEELDVTIQSIVTTVVDWPEEPRAQFGAVRDLLDAAESPLSTTWPAPSRAA